MKTEFLSYYYAESESIVVQGKEAYKRAIKRGFVEKQGGNGTYRMYKPSEAMVKFRAEDLKIRECSVKALIRDYYNYKNVTEKRLVNFCDEWKTGKIKVKYSEEKGLHV